MGMAKRDDNWANDPEVTNWMALVQEELVPKLEQSQASVSLVPEGEPDIKFAVELGLSILLDKPIIAVVRPGTKIPDKLAQVADHIVEGSMATREETQKIAQRIEVIMAKMDEDA